MAYEVNYMGIFLTSVIIAVIPNITCNDIYFYIAIAIFFVAEFSDFLRKRVNNNE